MARSVCEHLKEFIRETKNLKISDKEVEYQFCILMLACRCKESIVIVTRDLLVLYRPRLFTKICRDLRIVCWDLSDNQHAANA